MLELYHSKTGLKNKTDLIYWLKLTLLIWVNPIYRLKTEA